MTDSRTDIDEIAELLRAALHTPGAVAHWSADTLDLALKLLRRGRLLGRVAVDTQRVGVFDALPRIARDQLEGAQVMAQARRRVALWELRCIARAMRETKDVRLICTKGCAYALLELPNERGRIFADVDLLVAESDLDIVERTLERHGWQMKELTPYDDNYYRLWTHELPPMVHPGREVEVDIHHNIVPRKARLCPDAALLVADAGPIPDSRFDILSETDLLIHTMVHLMFDSDMADKIRDLVDIHDLLVHFGQRGSFWRELLDRSQELGLQRPVFYSIRYAKSLLDTEVPQAVLDRVSAWGPLQPVQWLMDKSVPRALLPLPPTHRSFMTSVARFLLYVRSFWIRMPPWLLAYHFAHKMFVVAGHRLRAHRPDASPNVPQ